MHWPHNYTMDMFETEDRISDLPDSLILEILFPLPEKEAIRTSCLSKRWVHLWTLLPNFIFIINDNQSRSDFFSFVDKTITQSRQPKLKKFHLHSSYDSSFQSLVSKCIRYALDSNVQDVDLELNHVEKGEQIVLDDSLFVNSSLINLKLSCNFANPTTDFFQWINLRSLSLSNKSDLEDLSLSFILSETPHLETFELNDCYGFTYINITSKSLKNFVISGRERLSDYGDIVEVVAPHILSLTVVGALTLCSLYFENFASLVEAKFCYRDDESDYYIPFYHHYEEEYMLMKHIVCLSKYKKHKLTLKLGRRCSRVLSLAIGDDDDDFVLPVTINVVDVEEF